MKKETQNKFKEWATICAQIYCRVDACTESDYFETMFWNLGLKMCEVEKGFNHELKDVLAFDNFDIWDGFMQDINSKGITDKKFMDKATEWFINQNKEDDEEIGCSNLDRYEHLKDLEENNTSHLENPFK